MDKIADDVGKALEENYTELEKSKKEKEAANGDKSKEASNGTNGHSETNGHSTEAQNGGDKSVKSEPLFQILILPLKTTAPNVSTFAESFFLQRF